MAASATEIDEAIGRVLSGFPEIACAWLFGSTVRGEARSDSDVDLGLVFRKRGQTALDHYRMLGDVAGRLEALFPGRPIDLVVLEPQGPMFCHAVLAEGRLVYDADPERRCDFVSDTISKYLDFRPTYDRMTSGRIDGFRSWLEARR